MGRTIDAARFELGNGRRVSVSIWTFLNATTSNITTVYANTCTTSSFLAGSLPLFFSLSQRQLRLITAVGTGVLVGTSLIVIIPEGIETLYSAGGAQTSSLASRSVGLSTRDVENGYASAMFRRDGPKIWRRGEDVVSTWERDERDIWRRSAREGDEDAPTNSALEDWEDTGAGFDQGNLPSSSDEGHDEQSSVDPPSRGNGEIPHSSHDSTHSTTSREPHAWVGVSLIMGFILMYLIDTIPKHAASSSQPTPSYISLGNFSLSQSPTTETNGAASSVSPVASFYSSSSSTTVGLVIHAAADGIALGASTTTATNHLSFIIFLAIMIHKAPAAFGLTSVLLKQGLSKRQARTHLIVFSLAAPAGAIATWAAAHIIGGFGQETEFATGVLLLFSGGTFLYVAMHTMQDAGHSHEQGEEGMNRGFGDENGDGMYLGSSPGMGKAKAPAGGMVDVLAVVGGMLLPLLTQFGHVH